MKRFFISNFKFITFNLTLIIFLFLGIQNSNVRKKVTFLNYETIKLPFSLIVGTSFIAGSISGKLIFDILSFKKDD